MLSIRVRYWVGQEPVNSWWVQGTRVHNIYIANILYQQRDSESRSEQTANANLHHVTKFSLFFSFIASVQKIRRFLPFFSIRIVLSCFYPLIFYFGTFST